MVRALAGLQGDDEALQHAAHQLHIGALLAQRSQEHREAAVAQRQLRLHALIRLLAAAY